MDGKNSLDCFQFDNHLVPNDQINLISAVEWKAFVDERKRHLPSEIQPHEMEFMAETFLIREFEKPRSEVTMDLDGGGDNRAGPGIAMAVFFGRDCGKRAHSGVLTWGTRRG